jgi:hypothetical protein
MGRLVIKFPSRNRPEKFKSVFTKYLTFLSGRHYVRFILTLDEDDPTMNNPKLQQWIATRARNAQISYFYGQSKTKVEACNADLDGVDGDVLLLASDDMVPVHLHYDEVIFAVFRQTFPDFTGAIKFWDGVRPKEDPLMTLSVIGFPLYRQFGYIYHPDYKSMCCDNEQTQVFTSLKKLRRCDICVIGHQWTNELFDTLHARNLDDSLCEMDKETFRCRLSKNFYLEDITNARAKMEHFWQDPMFEEGFFTFPNLYAHVVRCFP